MPTATMTSKGQITIPIELRKALGLETGDKIDFFEVETGGSSSSQEPPPFAIWKAASPSWIISSPSKR